jgi:hypothetical protein
LEDVPSLRGRESECGWEVVEGVRDARGEKGKKDGAVWCRERVKTEGCWEARDDGESGEMKD